MAIAGQKGETSPKREQTGSGIEGMESVRKFHVKYHEKNLSVKLSELLCFFISIDFCSFNSFMVRLSVINVR